MLQGCEPTSICVVFDARLQDSLKHRDDLSPRQTIYIRGPLRRYIARPAGYAVGNMIRQELHCAQSQGRWAARVVADIMFTGGPSP